MAMTKKEKAEFEAAIKRANTLSALRWTDPVEKDLPRPDRGSTSGWDYNAYSVRVYQAWSEPVSHGDGPARNGYSGSQGGIALFSTKLLALKALRHAVECDSAEKLRKIDEMIEKERLAE